MNDPRCLFSPPAGVSELGGSSPQVGSSMASDIVVIDNDQQRPPLGHDDPPVPSQPQAWKLPSPEVCSRIQNAALEMQPTVRPCQKRSEDSENTIAVVKAWKSMMRWGVSEELEMLLVYVGSSSLRVQVKL